MFRLVNNKRLFISDRHSGSLVTRASIQQLYQRHVCELTDTVHNPAVSSSNPNRSTCFGSSKQSLPQGYRKSWHPRTPAFFFLSPGVAISYDDLATLDVSPDLAIETFADRSLDVHKPDLDDTQEKRDGVFSRNSETHFADILDGLSNTLIFGERQNGPFRKGGVHGPHFSYETAWAGAIREISDPTDDHGHMVLFQTGHTPNNVYSDDRDVSAPHIGYANFLFGDGSVRLITEQVDFGVYQCLSTRAGGEVDAFEP